MGLERPETIKESTLIFADHFAVRITAPSLHRTRLGRISQFMHGSTRYSNRGPDAEVVFIHQLLLHPSLSTSSSPREWSRCRMLSEGLSHDSITIGQHFGKYSDRFSWVAHCLGPSASVLAMGLCRTVYGIDHCVQTGSLRVSCRLVFSLFI